MQNAGDKPVQRREKGGRTPEQWREESGGMEVVTLTPTRMRAFIVGWSRLPPSAPRVPSKRCAVLARERRSRREDGGSQDGGAEMNDKTQTKYVSWATKHEPIVSNGAGWAIAPTQWGNQSRPYNSVLVECRSCFLPLPICDLDWLCNGRF